MVGIFRKKIEKFRKWQIRKRDYFFQPLLKIFSSLKIKPSHLSNLKIIFGIIFFISFKKELVLSFISIFLGLFLDILDGPLARYQKKAHDRGKFIDIFTDYLFYSFIILANFKLKFIKKIDLGFHLLLISLIYLLAIIKKHETTPTNWLIKPQAEVGYFKFIFFLFFFLYLFFEIQFLNEVIFFLNLWIALLSIFYYLIILKRWNYL